jgi:hypothetical protein
MGEAQTEWEEQVMSRVRRAGAGTSIHHSDRVESCIHFFSSQQHLAPMNPFTSTLSARSIVITNVVASIYSSTTIHITARGQ